MDIRVEEALSTNPARLATPHPLLYSGLARVIGETFSITVGGVQTSNSENLPIDGPYIMAPNHRSILDPVILSYALQRHNGHQVHYIAKLDLWEQLPGKLQIGKFLESFGAFGVDRNKPLQPETASHVAHITEHNGIVGIFAEGAIKQGHAVERLKRGIGLLALKHQLPVVPVGLAGMSWEDLGPVHIAFGEPITPTELPDKTADATLLKLARPLAEDIRSGMQKAFDAANAQRDAHAAARLSPRRSRRGIQRLARLVHTSTRKPN